MEKEIRRKRITSAVGLLLAFAAWTLAVTAVDVQAVGPKGSEVGFARINVWFHELTGIHWLLYTITDWLGLVPIFICMVFGLIGFVQLVTRRSLFKVDADILVLGLYYVLVIAGYLFFEMVPINYRPVLIEGFLEASYPSSTTLLVLCVMPSAVIQFSHRVGNRTLCRVLNLLCVLFSVFMVGGRLFSGVHWLTDIFGAGLLSAGLVMTYLSVLSFVRTDW